ncbi:hypothetical protein B0I35DRAFT_431248 [Stachybotrys elegans]|uniref:Uncharacterized protein n=1 Tax=Stachybotrys elegans TaxID=80388 RepID=A0A8K0WQF6_9HYPO|nr:hypothetical protein B0I35DRAFT_431248 [Stachybotrys elegans]
MKSFAPATLMAIATFAGALVSGAVVQRAPTEATTQMSDELVSAIDMLESRLVMRLGMNGAAAQENTAVKRQAPPSWVGAQGAISSQSSSIQSALTSLSQGQVSQDDAISEIVKQLTGTTETLADVVVDITDAAGLDINRVDANAIQVIIVDIVDEVLGIVESVIDSLGLRPEIAQLLDTVVNLLGQILVGVDELGSGIIEGVEQLLEPILSGLGGVLEPIVDLLNNLLSGLTGALSGGNQTPLAVSAAGTQVQ